MLSPIQTNFDHTVAKHLPDEIAGPVTMEHLAALKDVLRAALPTDTTIDLVVHMNVVIATIWHHYIGQMTRSSRVVNP